MRLRYLGIPICLVLAFVVASRLRWPGSEGDVPPIVAQQRAKWQAARPSQYILTVNHGSVAGPAWFTLSKLKGGTLENVLCRRYEANGSIIECAVSDSLYPITVDQVFAAVEGAYRGKVQGMDVQYDSRYGFPSAVHVDPVAERKGDEWNYAVEVSAVAE
jgi:hypothetical protein